MAVATSTMLAIAGIGLATVSAISGMSAADKAAKATIREGNLVAANKAKETKLKAARLQTSFLNSGLTLEGTPMAAIDDTFNTGLADIEQIGSNYNNQAKKIISNARTSALTGLATAVISAGAMRGLEAFGTLGEAAALNPAAASVWESGAAAGAGFSETLKSAKYASFLNPV